MAKSKVIGAIVEELVGLATMLIPEPKPESPKFSSLPGLDVDMTMDNIKNMKSLLSQLKEKEAFTSCPGCLDHLARIEEELNWAEERVPTYQKVVRLRRQLGELYALVKPGAAELPLEIPEKHAAEAVVEKPAARTGQRRKLDYCLECSEKHGQGAKVFMREGLQRFERGNREGAVEKIRGVVEELTGLEDDTDSSKDVPEVRAINREARDIRREIWDKKLALGQGSIDDFRRIYGRLDSLVNKVYSATEKVA